MAYLIFSLSLLLVYMGLALALHVQFGMLGIANFGVVGFWGLGMYAMGVFQIQLELSFFDALLLVALLSLALSWIMGKLILRLDAQAMLCATIAFAAIVSLLVVTEKWATMGVVGLGTIRYPVRIGDGTEYFYFACLLALIVGLQILVLRLHRSPTGRLLLAIRDNEELCASLGKDTFRYQDVLVYYYLHGDVHAGRTLSTVESISHTKYADTVCDFCCLDRLGSGWQGTFAGCADRHISHLWPVRHPAGNLHSRYPRAGSGCAES